MKPSDEQTDLPEPTGLTEPSVQPEPSVKHPPDAAAGRAWGDAEGSDRVQALWRRVFGSAPAGVWAAPGRVNLIGEHVDYNRGPCLPIAVPHRTFVAIRPRPDDTIRMVSALAPEQVWTGTLAAVADGSAPGWVGYAAGPVWALAELGHRIGGFDAAIDSCLPLGAGLSSSAALECSVALAIAELAGLGLADTDAGRSVLAVACVRAENDIVGAPTGGMDQAASLRSQPGHALLVDTLDQSAGAVRCDLAGAGLQLLVIDTRVSHALVDGQYAARRWACEQAAAQLGVGSLREVTDLDATLVRLTDPMLRRRTRHVVTEIDRVWQVHALLRAGRVGAIGPALDASHASLRDEAAPNSTRPSTPRVAPVPWARG
jgi:galactokinase